MNEPLTANNPARLRRAAAFESLEPRSLMAVTAVLSGGTLVINADPLGGVVEARPVDSVVRVTGPGAALSFPAASINALRFNGSARNDTFTNNTSLTATIYGQAGNDTLHGGNGMNTIYGGEGHDTITGRAGTTTRVATSYGFGPNGVLVHTRVVTVPTTNYLYGGAGNDHITGGTGTDRIDGESGNDVLLGRDGTDYLWGSSGDDSLFGGRGGDTLTGGEGNDRFLRLNGGSTLTDANWNADAELNFSDQNLVWSYREIEELDEAFAQLQNRVGGATWIFRDTFTDDRLTFFKVRWGDIGEAIGRNSISWSPFDYDRKIEIVDWNEINEWENQGARSTLIHEIGHNWDGTGRPLAGEANPYWNGFAALHAQSSQAADYVWSYGATSAEDDWATVWQMYFGHSVGPAQPSTLLRAKLALVDAFFSLPADWL